MSRIPDDLDPRTLRWVADEHDAIAAGDDAYLDHIGGADDPEDEVAQRWVERAREERRKARRLRSLATRIERRRTGGRHAR